MFSVLKAELLDRLNILVIKKPAPYSSLFENLGRVGPKHPLQTSVAFGVVGGPGSRRYLESFLLQMVNPLLQRVGIS